MKNFLNLFLLSHINIFIAQEPSYFQHRYSGLQAYPNPFHTRYDKIKKLENLLAQTKNNVHKDIISIIHFTTTLDTLSLDQLSEFKIWLEKEFLKEKTMHHRVDLLLAESLWEEKYKATLHQSSLQETETTTSHNSSFRQDVQSYVIKLNSLKKHAPLRYINFLLKVLRINDTQTIDTRTKCLTAITILFSPIKIEDQNSSNLFG